jgi:hypothetical protein
MGICQLFCGTVDLGIQSQVVEEAYFTEWWFDGWIEDKGTIPVIPQLPR